MKLIECTKGSTTQNISGVEYAFQRDGYGRFVCEVHDEAHQQCFLAVQHYRAVPRHPVVPDVEAASTTTEELVQASQTSAPGLSSSEPVGTGETTPVQTNEDPAKKPAETSKEQSTAAASKSEGDETSDDVKKTNEDASQKGGDNVAPQQVAEAKKPAAWASTAKKTKRKQTTSKAKAAADAGDKPEQK